MKRAEKPFVEIYSDGACSGNPGVGGYGAILRSGGKEKELGGCEEMTTNNRMELLGAITALEALKKPCRVKLVTDSNYVVKGMNEWVGEWQKKSWKTSQKKDVLNRDLWERLLKASAPHDIEWQWIRGHDGHTENERCDRLAREEITRCKREMKHEEA
jgi:ribonuclease HI